MADKASKQLTLDQRMQLFKELVEAQDQELGTARSRQLIATRFGVEESEVRRIEEEGLQEEWPPL